MSNQSISKKLFIPLSLAAVLLVGLGVFIGVQWNKLGDVGVASDGTNAVQQPYTPDTCEGNSFTDYDEAGNKSCREYTVTQLLEESGQNSPALLKNQTSDIFIIYDNYKDDPEISTYEIKRLNTDTDTITDYVSIPRESNTSFKVSPNNVLYSFKINIDSSANPPTLLGTTISKFNQTTKVFEPYINLDVNQTGFSQGDYASIDSQENIYLVSGWPGFYLSGSSYDIPRHTFAVVDTNKNVEVVPVSANEDDIVIDLDIAKDNTAFITYANRSNAGSGKYTYGVRKTTLAGTLENHGEPITVDLEDDLGVELITAAYSKFGLDNTVIILMTSVIGFPVQNYIQIRSNNSQVRSMSNFIEEHISAQGQNFTTHNLQYLADSSLFATFTNLYDFDLTRFSKNGEFKKISTLYSNMLWHSDSKYYLSGVTYGSTDTYRIAKMEFGGEIIPEPPEPEARCVDFETLTSTGKAPKDQLKVSKQFSSQGFRFSLSKTKANTTCPTLPQIAVKGPKGTAFVGFGDGTIRQDNPHPDISSTVGNYFLTDDGTISKSACQLNVAVEPAFRSNRIEFDILDVDYRQAAKPERFNVIAYGKNSKKLKTVKTPAIDEPSKSYKVVVETTEPIFSLKIVPIGSVSNWGVAYDNFCSVK